MFLCRGGLLQTLGHRSSLASSLNQSGYARAPGGLRQRFCVKSLRQPLDIILLIRRRSNTLQHIICEEKLAVIRNHHDLYFVGKLLGDDLLN